MGLFVDGDILDDGDVDGGEGARAVDLIGGHCCGVWERCSLVYGNEGCMYLQ